MHGRADRLWHCIGIVAAVFQKLERPPRTVSGGVLRAPLGGKLAVEVDQVPVAGFLRDMLHCGITRLIRSEFPPLIYDGAIGGWH